MNTSQYRFMRSPLALVLAATLASAASLPAYAAGITDFTVTTAPVNGAGLAPQQVVSNANGGFMLAWNDSFTYGYGQSYVQAFASGGVPIGSPVAVGDATGSTVSLAASNNGDYVASWIQTISGSQHFVLQRFAADGTPKGALVDLATVPTAFSGVGKKSAHAIIPMGPVVAMDDDGDAAVVWEIVKQSGFDCSYGCLINGISDKVYAAVYNADNSVKQKAKVVYSTPLKFFSLFSTNDPGDFLDGVAMDGAGDIAIALDHGGDSPETTALLRCNLSLSSIGPLQVIPGSKTFRGLGLDNAGNATVAWLSVLYTQMTVARFDPSGNTLSSIAYNGANGSLGSLLTMPSGAFAIQLFSYDNIDFFGDGNLWPSDQFSLQYFNADGSINGSPVTVTDDSADLNQIVINDTNYGDQMAMSLDNNGNSTFVWQALLPDQINTALLGSQVNAP